MAYEGGEVGEIETSKILFFDAVENQKKFGSKKQGEAFWRRGTPSIRSEETENRHKRGGGTSIEGGSCLDHSCLIKERGGGVLPSEIAHSFFPSSHRLKLLGGKGKQGVGEKDV